MTYEDFREALKQRESSGNYQAVNSFGYLGAYQFGEAALVDLGFVVNDGNPYDNQITAWTGKMGIDSTAEFLASPSVQDAAADEWFELLWGYAESLGLDAYLGQTIDGVYITASAIIAGAHLMGAGGMRDWLASGGTLDLTDGYGTPIEEYLALFTGYEMPFDTGETPGDLVPPAALHLIGDADVDFLYGGTGTDILEGAAGSDLLFGADGNDRLYGGDGFDVINGGAGDDTLDGGAGMDIVGGGMGGDVITGGAGRDFLFGGDGRDEITGGTGDDILTGQGGTDLFIFADDWGQDVITDFDASSTGDVIVLRDVAAITDYADLVANHMTQVAGGVLIHDGAGNAILLPGYTLGELETGDFVF